MLESREIFLLLSILGALSAPSAVQGSWPAQDSRVSIDVRKLVFGRHARAMIFKPCIWAYVLLYIYLKKLSNRRYFMSFFVCKKLPEKIRILILNVGLREFFSVANNICLNFKNVKEIWTCVHKRT